MSRGKEAKKDEDQEEDQAGHEDPEGRCLEDPAQAPEAVQAREVEQGCERKPRLGEAVRAGRLEGRGPNLRNLTPRARALRLPAMTDATNRGSEKADAAVKRTVTAFMSHIELMFGKWEAITPAHIVEGALVELCEEVSELVEDIKTGMGPETQKLLDAMAEYRDSNARAKTAPTEPPELVGDTLSGDPEQICVALVFTWVFTSPSLQFFKISTK